MERKRGIMEEAIQNQGEMSDNSEMKKLFVVTCVSGFDQIANGRSAFMFATLAAAAEFRTILYLTQHGVDFVVKGATEKREEHIPGFPTLAQRIEEALEMGVEIQVCSQSIQNKKLGIDDLIPGVTIEGAMHLIDLAAEASGILCF
jgi:predicted peroxiredoxin